MGSFSIWHWIVVGAIVLLVFGGKGKISDLMGDVAKGIKSFKKGMSEDDTETAKAEPARIEPVSPATHTNAAPTSTSTPVQPADHASEPRKAS
jgi:sec-independent protein translocase protein TatA